MLNQLTVYLTDGCNLACSYCYESAPAPRAAPRHHDVSLTEKVATTVATRGGVKTVQFFGGEATLRIDLLESIVITLHNQAERGSIPAPPRFNVVTNGVFADPERVVKTLKRWTIRPTVSLDGPAPVHDSLRRTRRGQGTHATVCANIARLIDAGLPVTVESVISKAHLEAGIGIADILDHCMKIGAERVFIFPVVPRPGDSQFLLAEQDTKLLLRSYEGAVDEMLSRLVAERKWIRWDGADILAAILDGRALFNERRCPAGLSSISLLPDGTLIPCYAFHGLSNDPFKNTAPPNDVCAACAARPWCQYCPGLNRRFTGSSDMPAPLMCAITRAIVRRIAACAFRYLVIPRNGTTEGLYALGLDPF